MRAPFALFALAALTAEACFAMNPTASDAPPALSLKVERHGSRIAVELLGHSPRAQQVSYLLELSGHSTSRHRGTTTLAADTPVRLSTMAAEVGEDWCVRLMAQEEGREPYELREGSCPDAD